MGATGTSPYGFAPVEIVNGNGLAVYEVMKADAIGLDTIDIPVAITYASPGLGAGRITGSLAPLTSMTTRLPSIQSRGSPMCRRRQPGL